MKTRTQKAHRNNQQSLMSMGVWARGLRVVVLVLVAVGFSGHASAKSGDTEGLSVSQKGVITAVETKSIKIENRDYPLSRNVIIKLDAGATRTLSYLKPGQEVQFHLNRGRIDQIIILQPS